MAQSWTPKSDVAKAVHLAGFQYDPQQDIIFSRMDAWQREFGYAFAYDLAAPVTISAIIDCEPFFFHYDKKDWMIELWKGQYGLETGCEIGVYVSTRQQLLLDSTLGKRPHDPANSRFFDCADDKERLKLSFTLNRNGVPLFSRGPEDHWWLTGFKWGVLSTPEELAMDLSITFPVAAMRKAFVAALEKAGYQNISMNAETVSFRFDKPTSMQPRLDPSCKVFVQSAWDNNSKIVKHYQYLKLSNNDPNQIPGEFAAYFDVYNPKHFKQHLVTALQPGEYSLQHVDEALESLFKQTLHPLTRILNSVINFFKKLFG
jgi:hypothetical protein